MTAPSKPLRYALCVALVTQSIAPTSAQADPFFGRLKRMVHESTYHGSEPATCEVGAIEELAENIDWLEHHIDSYGSIVAKQPDIWGEARLTKHRDEYERVMFTRLGGFGFRLNAAITQADAAFLAQALALSAAASGTAPSVSTVAAGTAASAAANTATAQLKAATVGTPDNQLAERFGITDANKIGLEPTIEIDQMSRYLNHLHELRRINEGDDTSDSPGYSMNLVRIPVSILPGKLTREGFGAEVTVTCTPVLSDDLLPTTFRNLVVNDVVHQLRLPVTRAAEELLAPVAGDKHSGSNGSVLKQFSASSTVGFQRGHLPYFRIAEVIGDKEMTKIANDFKNSYDGKYVRWNGGPKCDPKNVDLLDVHRWLDPQATAAYELLTEPQHLGVYAALAAPGSGLVNQLRNGHIETKQGTQEAPSVAHYRHYFFEEIHRHASLAEQLPQGFAPCENHPDLAAAIFNTNTSSQAETSVEAIAWAILVESALLNDQLNRDVRKLAEAKGVYELQTDRQMWFFLPDSVTTPGLGFEPLQAEFDAATDVFQQYVKARWPIHVFAIDPREQDQNVADVSARSRELQFALAVGFVTGKIGANSLTQYSRRLETQVETITLNRTIVGFGHGSDTFGWRFQPRVQALDVPGTLGSIRETLCGTSRDYDLKHRQIEPGQRECVAVVLMPSFIPYADFDVRTNWFKLTNPKNAALTMKDTVRLSRAVTAMRNSRAQCSQCAHLYREGEVARMMKRVDQLDRELPLQSMRALVPYENTLGGFEMFNTGVTDLAPELIGWYGAPGIDLDPTACGCYRGCNLINAECSDAEGCEELNDQLKALGETLKTLNAENQTEADDPLAPCNGPGTTLFLVGKNFSVHDTKVIAGGVCIPHVRLVSREIMQVTIPHCVNTVKLCENGSDKPNEYVAVYAATPYGVTSHLHVPVTAQAPRAEARAVEAQINASVAAQVEAQLPVAMEDLRAELGRANVTPKTARPVRIAIDLSSRPVRPVVSDAPALDFHLATPAESAEPMSLLACITKGDRFLTGLETVCEGKSHQIVPERSLKVALTKAMSSDVFLGEYGALAKSTTDHLKIRFFVAPKSCPSVVTPILRPLAAEVTVRCKCSDDTPVATGQADTLHEPVESIEAGGTPAAGAQTDCGCGPKLTEWSPWRTEPTDAGPFSLAQFSTLAATEPEDALDEVTASVEENARLLKDLAEKVDALAAAAGESPQAGAASEGEVVEPLPQVVNVTVAPVAPPAPRHKHWHDENHPLIQQAKTQAMECWRNVRDALPAY